MPGSTAGSPPVPLRLRRFEAWQAYDVAGWVETPEELHWLAPSTRHPLTADKVLRWKQPAGLAVTWVDGNEQTIGYAELNPMRLNARHCWLGHVIVRPACRGRGVGASFVRTLVRFGLKELRATRLSLIVFPDNVAAVRCYRRAGFHVAGFEDHRFHAFGSKHRLLRLEIEPSAAWA
jgi:RimJ/RimL family protein N-acetyltransferase